ncbi:hypothetical protein SAMN05660226_02015 [Parapedobacter luteus]|uniref:Membrane-bound lysozyme-inhibitor of c-type lysozyme n=1 Tax=Parapedobacter luteus TaxID=623280 RepID=A0A1T5CAZ9_9SPHI|nr:hypothetical protein [Parapedobacter luteus]SKB56533.1 hypothetical protein SAMN05660226_02015 [Parapedobacter luteus]
MKSLLIIVLLAGALFITSCQSAGYDPEPAGNANAAITSRYDIVTRSATNARGDTLTMTFDKAAGIAMFILKSDTIWLEADATASGVRYSNDRYRYTEHHGVLRLTKDGQPLFEHKR